MRIGLIGAGAIANFLLEKLNEGDVENFTITSLLVRDREKYKSLEDEFSIKIFTDLQAFLKEDIDIIVEAADIQAVKDLVPTILEKKPVLLISVGALADEELLTSLQQTSCKHNHPLYLPTGAIGGLDILQNASVLGNVTSVMLTTRKPANTLTAEEINESKVIFEGTSAEAIQKFPKNMNVSIILALASLGFEETKVILVADPHIKQNIHQIEMTGDFGEATIVIKNNALPANPKTSYLAAMSIIGTLKRLNSKFIIG